MNGTRDAMGSMIPTGTRGEVSGPHRRWSRGLMAILLILLAFWIFRYPILRSLGSFLVRTDPTCKGDALYVLGGAPFDRGSKAAELIRNGCASIAYCTGSSISQNYKAEGRMLTEAELTRAAAIRNGAPAGQVLPFPYGTSTFEEAQAILRHARILEMVTILVLTTDLHTRRVSRVFQARSKGSGITVLVQAAPSSEYDVRKWWTSEQGLLMVNNEYVKTLYYLFKYGVG